MRLAEICDKYTHSHDFIIAADFNVNLTKASPRQSRLKSMMMERCQLSTFNCPDRPTFVHYNGLGSSQIDFIIGSQHLNLDVTVHDTSPLNTSTLNASLHSNQSMKCPTPPAVPAPRPRILLKPTGTRLRRLYNSGADLLVTAALITTTVA